LSSDEERKRERAKEYEKDRRKEEAIDGKEHKQSIAM
jgi:hypothetical protein